MSTDPIDKLLGTEYHKSLVTELQCQCGGYLEPPIKLCANGHGACCRCRRKLKKCPICNEIFSEVRSVALEALADKLKFPCSNEGCSVKLIIRELESHTSECNFRVTSCFMNKIHEHCSWTGTASDWLEHCLHSHTERVTDASFITFSGLWSPKREPIMRYHLLRSFDRIFNVYQIYDFKTCKMMWSVVTTLEEPVDKRMFYFNLDIFIPNDVTRRISFRQMCKTSEDADILDPKNNVLISLEQILYMLDDEKNLHYTLTINEIKNL